MTIDASVGFTDVQTQRATQDASSTDDLDELGSAAFSSAAAGTVKHVAAIFRSQKLAFLRREQGTCDVIRDI